MSIESSKLLQALGGLTVIVALCLVGLVVVVGVGAVAEADAWRSACTAACLPATPDTAALDARVCMCAVSP